MELWKLRAKLPKPITRRGGYVPVSGLLRGVVTQADRRPHRATPAAIAVDAAATRYWRPTPLLSLPRARVTPSVASRRAQSTAGGYLLSSPWPLQRSTVTVTNTINSPATSSTAHGKKLQVDNNNVLSRKM